MPIRDIGSNYRNKIHQMMDDVDVIRQNLPEGSYVRIYYPSERQIIFMRADKIFPVESSFYGMSAYEGIIDLSFQGPAYVYTYDEFENPINLECYENYNLNNAINRNTSSTTDDPDSIDIISESVFHNAFMELMDKFYFNNYIWPLERDMSFSYYETIEDYKMTTFFRRTELEHKFPIFGKYKIDIIFQIPGNLSEEGDNIMFDFKGDHDLSLKINGARFYLEYDKVEIYSYDFDFFDGDKYYQEDKFHVMIRYLDYSYSGYIYIESLRTGKRTYSVLSDIKLSDDGNSSIHIYTDCMIGIERLRIWSNDSLLVDIVPLEDLDKNPVFYNLISHQVVFEKGSDVESW